MASNWESPALQFLACASRPQLAYRRRLGTGPTILFLPGYGSDMDGTKALALDTHASATGRSLLRFDYGGCGSSEGAFTDQTLEDWRDDALAILDALSEGPLILVGSSMGGWLMLLTALARRERVVGMVGIAAAPDFTDWGFDAVLRDKIERDGILFEPSPYGEPMVMTRDFWRSAQRQRLLANEIAIDVPVRLLHGQHDAEVPWKVSVDVAARLRSADVQLTLVKDGDHRLSRESDIALLLATVEGLCSRF